MTNEIETLIKQIGRGTFAMLGASELVTDDDALSLQFRIRGCEAGNKIRITYRRNADAYDVELWKIRGADARLVEDMRMVYADALHATIERLTGLRTRL